MELYQLRTFITVIEECSISGAARRLSITPSSVSTHIKALETEFGVQLFVRTHQGVEVTDSGQILAEHARQTLLVATRLTQKAVALQQHLVGHVQIGISVSPHVFDIPDFFRRLQRSYAEIQVELTQSETASILHQLHQDAVDMGIVFGEIDDPTLIVHPLKQVELVIALPKAWSNQIDETWQSLTQFPWIHTGMDCPFQSIMDRMCQEQGIQPEKFIRSNDDRTRFELVRAEMGVSILERSEAIHPEITIFDTIPMLCPVSLAYQVHRQFDSMIQAIRDLIMD